MFYLDARLAANNTKDLFQVIMLRNREVVATLVGKHAIVMKRSRGGAAYDDPTFRKTVEEHMWPPRGEVVG